MEEQETIIPEAAKPKKRIKPYIEGINTPSTKKVIYVKPTMTDQDLLPDDSDGGRIVTPKIAERAAKKSNGARNFILGLIILAAVAYGAYWSYGWYQGQNTMTAVTPTPQQQMQAATSTDFGMPASTTPPLQATASSTPNATTTPSSMATTTPAATASGHTLTINTTPTGYLNVRADASSSASLITQVHPGETYAYTDSKSGWYHITLPNNKTGWVSGQYVTAK